MGMEEKHSESIVGKTSSLVVIELFLSVESGGTVGTGKEPGRSVAVQRINPLREETVDTEKYVNHLFN